MTASAVLWAGNAVVARALKDDASGVFLSFWRWALAIAVMAPFVWRGIVAKRDILRRRWAYLLFCGWVSTAPNNAIVFTALKSTTAINVQLFNSVIPVWVLLVSWLAFKRPPHRAEAWGVAVSLAGVLVIVTEGMIGRLLSFDLNGADLAVLTVFFFWGVYSASLRFRPLELTAFEFSFVCAVIGTALLAPVHVYEVISLGQWPQFTVRLLAGVAFLALISSLLAATLYSAGIDRLGPSRGSLFIHLVPVFGVAMSVGFLGEALRWYHLLGFVLVLAGLAVANRGRGLGSG